MQPATKCASCGAELDAGARFCGGCGKAVIPTEMHTQMAIPQPNAVGREIAGRYRILAKLGEGGMGAVYRAEQISVKRTCALKLLKPELSKDKSLVKRFNAEAQLVARINHPNTVTLYDFGQDTDGSMFIAMEFIDGVSLRDEVSQGGPMAPGRAIHIAEQVCASLADAHRNGIIHRDLKPDNVMLSERGGEQDVARVLDFGIAKLRDPGGDITANPMTQAGDMLGTPQYMAPEQIKGEAVDARTDIYALGAMLYEMVTGRMVFEAPTVMAVLSKQLTEMPKPAHERRPDLSIPLELSRLIGECLQKQIVARPPDMNSLRERLRALKPSIATAPGGLATGAAPSPVPRPGQVPSVVNPPPGVPRRLTPAGSAESPPPGGAMGHAPTSAAGALGVAPTSGVGPGQSPIAAALHVPGAQQGTAQPHSPPPAGPAPHSQAGPGQHAAAAAPTPSGPRTAPPGAGYQQPPPSAGASNVETLHVRSGDSVTKGWVGGLIALLVIAGGITAWVMSRSDDDADDDDDYGDTLDDDDDVPDLPDPPDDDFGKGEPSFDVEPNRKIYGDDPGGKGKPSRNRTDSLGDTKTYVDAITGYKLHYPKHMRINTSTPPWVGVEGVVDGVNLAAVVFGSPTLGQKAGDDELTAMTQVFLSQNGATLGKTEKRTFQGARRPTGTFTAPGNRKGQYVIFQTKTAIVIAAIVMPSRHFQSKSQMRDVFFNDAVELPK